MPPKQIQKVKTKPPAAPANNSQLDQIAQEMSRIGDILKHQNSLLHRFLSGILLGLGTAFGATIIAALFFLVIRSVLTNLGLDISQLLLGFDINEIK